MISIFSRKCAIFITGHEEGKFQTLILLKCALSGALIRFCSFQSLEIANPMPFVSRYYIQSGNKLRWISKKIAMLRK